MSISSQEREISRTDLLRLSIHPSVDNLDEEPNFYEYIPDTQADNNDDEIETCSTYSSVLTQLTPPCSEDFVLPPICVEMCAISNSEIVDNDEYVFEKCDVLGFAAQLEEHYNKVEDLKLHDYDKYLDNCNIYNVTPISALKKIFDGETELDLSGYGSDTLGIRLLAKALHGPPILNLTKLDLSYTLFDERACEALNELIRMSQTLQILNFANCCIGQEGLEILADGISLSPSITYMNFRNCNLRDEGGYIVCKAMAYNDFCKVLDLSYNKLYTNTGRELYNLLSNNTALEELDLSWNELYEEDAIMGLLNGLRDNHGLKKLSIAWNGFSNVLFGKLFRTAIKIHPAIEEIDLRDNRLSTIEAKFIAIGIKHAKNLRRIYLDHNPWTREDIMKFLKLIKPTSPVKYISFGNDFYVTHEEEEKIIMRKSKDPELEIIYKAAMMPNPPEAVNFRNILVDRIKYVAQKPKRKKLKRNAGDFMYKLYDQETEAVSFDEMHRLIKEFKMKMDKDLFDQTCVEWQKAPKKKSILINQFANYYLERHPTERPPPPPPKKKKGRKGKKKGDSPSSPKGPKSLPATKPTAAKKPKAKKK